MEKLPCGHPVQCLVDDDDGECCAWCEDKGHLTREIGSLRKAIENKAVVVHGGKVTVDGPIGYLAIYGGVVGRTADEPLSIFRVR